MWTRYATAKRHDSCRMRWLCPDISSWRDDKQTAWLKAIGNPAGCETDLTDGGFLGAWDCVLEDEASIVAAERAGGVGREPCASFFALSYPWNWQSRGAVGHTCAGPRLYARLKGAANCRDLDTLRVGFCRSCRTVSTTSD